LKAQFKVHLISEFRALKNHGENLTFLGVRESRGTREAYLRPEKENGGGQQNLAPHERGSKGAVSYIELDRIE
jgi:hypothetical protein